MSHVPTASEARSLAQFIVSARVSGRYHDILSMASDPLKQRVHFLALPDRSNLVHLLQWDLPSPMNSSGCACQAAFDLEDYLHSHWSAEQFHLPVPPGLTSTSSGLTLSTWDDVVPVYVQQTDRETLQAMVLLGQQGHCKVVMILRAEKAVEETEEEGDGCTPGSLNPKHNQDKHLGGVGREPSSPTHTRSLSPLLSNHETDAGLAAAPLKKRPPKARTVWKYHDLRVHHDPSEAWVSNLTKGWTLISDETTNRNTAPEVPAVGASDGMHHQLPTQPVTSQICGNKKDEDDDDDDDYWGQYGDADEEASSGESSLGQDQACLDEVVENNNIESSPSLPKTLEEDSDSDSDDDYWGQYANNDNSSDRKNSGSHDNLAQSEDNGTSYRPEFAALQQQYDEARQQKERSDSLSTQVDPHMLSSILQMLVNNDSEDPAEYKHQQKEQDENIDEEEPVNTRLLNEDIQEDSLSNISVLSSNQSSTQHGFNIKDKADVGKQNEICPHPTASPPLSATQLTSPQPLHSAIHLLSSSLVDNSHHPHEPPSPTSISNSPSYPSYCLADSHPTIPSKQDLQVSINVLVKQACHAGITKHQLLQLIDQQFTAHEISCRCNSCQ